MRLPSLASLLATTSVASLCAIGAIGAQPAYMVADLQTAARPDWSFGGVFAPRFLDVEGVGYFLHDDGIHGRELWRTDRTALGTYLIRDVCPGQCGASALTGPEHLAALGGFVLFAGNDGVTGTELWISDGTALGTRAVRDLRPGADSSAPAQMVAAAGQVFFTADDGINGRELWRSDGTLKGTYLVRDVTAGATGGDIQG
ncbi:MAG: hypothetical protein ABIV06_06880, partial [Thermoanaerobaculia bacterium]